MLSNITIYILHIENNEFITIENDRALKFNIIKKNMTAFSCVNSAAYQNRKVISFVAQGNPSTPTSDSASKSGNALKRFVQAENMENQRIKSAYPQSESSYNAPIKRSKSVSFAFHKPGIFI